MHEIFLWRMYSLHVHSRLTTGPSTGWCRINRIIYFCHPSSVSSVFLQKTLKHDNVHVAPWTLVKAVLNGSSTGCNNERQSFAKMSYSTIDNVLTNLLSAGLLSGAQRLVSYNNSKQAVGVYPRLNSPLCLSMGYSLPATSVKGVILCKFLWT